MYDRLLTPFGLLRGGVAPDHQKMKSVGAYYDRIMSKNRDKINFFGNIHVGTDISVAELQEMYDAVFFSYGAETDHQLGIPGEELQGSFSATEFVGGITRILTMPISNAIYQKRLCPLSV